MYQLTLAAFILTGCTGIGNATAQTPRAVNGTLDLRAWDFAADGPVALNGEWGFYWRGLQTSQGFIDPSPPQRGRLIPVPSPWDDLSHLPAARTA